MEFVRLESPCSEDYVYKVLLLQIFNCFLSALADVYIVMRRLLKVFQSNIVSYIPSFFDFFNMTVAKIIGIFDVELFGLLIFSFFLGRMPTKILIQCSLSFLNIHRKRVYKFITCYLSARFFLSIGVKEPWWFTT